MSKFFNISTDSTLGGNSPSDVTVSSQKAIKTYVDSQTGTAPAFANIVGQPSDNANLATALNAKYDASNPNGYTSNVGTVTSVNNVSPVNGNVTLSIPAAQVNSDWDASSGVAQILNKPTLGTMAAESASDYTKTSGLATVATTGDYDDLIDKPTIPTVNDATLTITQGGATKGTFTANASSDVTIDIDAGGGSSRNVGEIVASTIPLTDAGLHLLDGSLIPSGSYADFVDYIGDLYDSGNYSDLFDTEANWQTAVTTYGVCGKFVYDSVNGTVRLPKISGFIEGTLDVTKLGDLVEAGLPNITGSITDMMNRYQTITATGALSAGTVTAFKPSSGNYNLGYANISIDASASSSIYGNSSTVQPQAIKVLYYIVVANSTKTQIEVGIDEVMTDLNGKADVDLSNVNNTGKSLGAGWAMPSDTYDDLTLGASGATYTAPANGWYNVLVVAGGAGKYIDVKNPTTGMASRSISYQSTDWIGANLPVRKGDTIQIAYNSTGAVKNFRFIYAVGSESEAQNV